MGKIWWMCEARPDGTWQGLPGFVGEYRVVPLCVPVAMPVLRRGQWAVFFCVDALESVLKGGKKKTTYRLSKKGSMRKKKQVVIA